MKFPNKEHTVLSCGDVLTKTKQSDMCSACSVVETQWLSNTFKQYFCSDECLERQINDILQTEYNWWEEFRQ